MSLRGHRKLIVFFGAATYLLIGFGLSLKFPSAGLALYGIYVGGIGSAITLFTIGNVKEEKKP